MSGNAPSAPATLASVSGKQVTRVDTRPDCDTSIGYGHQPCISTTSSDTYASQLASAISRTLRTHSMLDGSSKTGS